MSGEGQKGKLTIQDIAASENVSEEAVRRWVNTGQLRAYKYPGTGKQPIVRIAAADFEAFKNRALSKKM